ncbi:hypothetical protein AOLI_G00282400 [Acnodon oligacanthus]
MCLLQSDCCAVWSTVRQTEHRLLTLPSLPATEEWLDSRCRGVRNASAYILVYDICCVESFEYVKMIRQQIVENRYIFPKSRPPRHHSPLHLQIQQL